MDQTEILHTQSGGAVDLVKYSDVPWLRLRRRTVGVRAMRSPMAVESEDPPGAERRPKDPAAKGEAPPPGGAMPSDGVVAPAPLEESEEARTHVGVRVPHSPSQSEKEEHYLTHIPFRSWCSFCFPEE